MRLIPGNCHALYAQDLPYFGKASKSSIGLQDWLSQEDLR
jgi:hypothetical protein